MIRKTHKTKRLILRPLQKSDYDVWFDAYANCLPKKSKWDRGPLERKLCTRKWFIKTKKKLEQLAKKDDYYRYYIFEKSTGRIIGLIDFDIFVRSTHQFANFGYQIYNRHWGKGYGIEASLKGLQIGFRDLKLNRLEAAINLDNRKSIKMARAIGMKREGIKKRYWFEYGKWTDHLIYVANPEDIGMKPRKPNR
jgi:[ribosomal protein S5]-alanine N-acetyltransferase